MIAALIMGLVSSLHCVGMCGPIALAIPTRRNAEQSTRTSTITNIFVYNAGRVTTYALYGFIFGLIGRSFAWFGWQQKISIALGVIILITILAPGILGKTNPLNTMTNNVFMKIREAMRRLLFKGHPGSLYGFGLLNGLLPCGMVYLALAGAIATGNAMDGALFMAMFGLGTMPSMAAMSYFGGMMTPGLRQGARKLLPAMMVVVATLLILRGLNLGIPYISPSLNMTSSTAVTCHD